MISFDNTEIAFKSKSNKELKRAYRLFSLLGKPFLMKTGTFLAIWSLKLRLPVKGIIKRTIFSQFCGGENIDECSKKSKELSEFGIGTILDYSVEGKSEEKVFDDTAKEIIKTAEQAAGNAHIPFCVFKVTGVARFGLLEKISSKEELSDKEKQEYLKVIQRVDSICKKAFEVNTPVFIDAEESWIQQAIDDMVDSMMARYNKERAIVYNTLQMYRHDRLDFLKVSHEKAIQGGYFLGVKLVRGAYMEKERERAKEKGYTDPIQPDKATCDKDYDAALTYMIENIDRTAICAGTHNENSSILLVELMEKQSIVKDDKRIYFAQLLGMSDHISFNLAHHGYNVAKYLPYGPVREVMPYLIRRAEENTSVAGQTGRELSLLQKEMKRRKG